MGTKITRMLILLILLTITTMAQKYDSTLVKSLSGENISKELFELNHNDSVVSKKTYYWNNVESCWKVKYRYIYEYDSLGHKIDDKLYQWNYDLEYWKGCGGKSFKYNKLGMITEYCVNNWNDSSRSWFPRYKYDTLYNVDGDVTKINYSYWVDSYDSLHILETEKNIYDNLELVNDSLPYIYLDTLNNVTSGDFIYRFYNEIGQPVIEESASWSESDTSWIPNHKVVISYVGDSLKKEEKYSWNDSLFKWDTSYTERIVTEKTDTSLITVVYKSLIGSNTWYKDSRETLHYNNQGLEVYKLIESYNSEQNKLEPIYYMNNEYDSLGRKILFYCALYDTDSTDFRVIQNYTYSFLINGDKIETIYRDDSVWGAGLSKDSTYTYADGSYTNVSFISDSTSMWVNNYKTVKASNGNKTYLDSYMWNNDDSLWDLSGSSSYEFFYYEHLSKVSLSVNKGAENLNFEVKCFPNPFLEKLHIKNDSKSKITVKLYNSTGASVFYSDIEDNEKKIIDTVSFDQGVYYLIIAQNGTVIAKKEIFKSQ